MGRTEFLIPTIRSEPRLESANHYESEMALFNECMQSCAHMVLDIADIVRDGDLSSTESPIHGGGGDKLIAGTDHVTYSIA